MRIEPSVIFYNGMASGPELKRCTAFLLVDMPQYLGSAIERVDLYPRCQTSDPIEQSLLQLNATFQENLQNLPYVRFRRKEKLFEVSYVSKFVYSSSMFGKEKIPLPPPDFECLCREFAWALAQARRRLKKTDDFNIAALEKHLEDRLATLPQYA
jgi:hypothetical protein